MSASTIVPSAILADVIAESAISAVAIVPSAILADVIAESAISAVAIVPSAIIPEVTVPEGSVTVPVNVGESIFAFSPTDVVSVVAKLASSLIAAANSLSVFRSAGAPSTSDATAAPTNAVVATCVVSVPAAAVGAVGVPVSAGDARGAFRSSAV